MVNDMDDGSFDDPIVVATLSNYDDASIIIEPSRESSPDSDIVSTLTNQSGVYGNDHLGVVDSAETVKSATNVDFSFSDIYKPFEPAKVYYGERQRFKAIQVPFAEEPTRIDRTKRACPRLSAKRHRFANNTPNDAVGVQAEGPAENMPIEVEGLMPNEAVGFEVDGLANNMPNDVGVQAQGDDVSLPIQGSGFRRSLRNKNKEPVYNENLLANRLPRTPRRAAAAESSNISELLPPQFAHCLRIRASTYFPSDSDEEDCRSDAPYSSDSSDDSDGSFDSDDSAEYGVRAKEGQEIMG